MDKQYTELTLEKLEKLSIIEVAKLYCKYDKMLHMSKIEENIKKYKEEEK